MKVPFVSFKPLEKELDTELRAAFERVFDNSWYIGGKEDEAFEEEFAKYIAYTVGENKAVFKGGNKGGYAPCKAFIIKFHILTSFKYLVPNFIILNSKNIFKEKCAIDPKLKGMPNIPAEYLPDFELVVNKAINPSEEEIKNNPRARRAKLRVIERIK